MEFMAEQFVNFIERPREEEREIHCLINGDSKNGYNRQSDTRVIHAETPRGDKRG